MENYKIINLSFLRNRKEILVTFDNNIAIKLPLDLVLRLKLKKGAILSEEDYKTIQKELSLFQVQTTAYNKATSTFKTRFQLKKILTQKGYPEDEIEIAIKKLEKLNIINDERYAQNVFEYLTTKKTYGNNKIKQYLIQKGVPRKIIDKVISRESQKVDQDELIISFYERNVQKIKRKKLTHRIPYCYRMLRNAGFSIETINNFINKFKPEIIEL